jgi:hypothetical protein
VVCERACGSRDEIDAAAGSGVPAILDAPIEYISPESTIVGIELDE